MSRRVCFALDLRDDAAAIAEYERIHAPGGVWPEVVVDLHAQGYRDMSIWRTGNRLFMIAELDHAAPGASAGPETQRVLDRWRELTSGLQQALPGHAGEPRWIEMKCVFDLKYHRPPHTT